MTATKQRPVRKNVPLDHGEVAALSALRNHRSDSAVALAGLTGTALGEKPSEATVLHEVVRLGLRLIDDEALKIAYQRESAFMAIDPECRMWEQWMQRPSLPEFMSDNEADIA